MIYWVTCEAPVTLISTCLPPMVNLIKRFNTTLLTPFTSKMSSVWSTHTKTSSTHKSRESNFGATLKGSSGANSKGYMRTTSSRGATRSLASMESRTELVDNRNDGSNPSVMIPLGAMGAKRPHQYSAYARGDERDDIDLSESGRGLGGIRVDREISVSHLSEQRMY